MREIAQNPLAAYLYAKKISKISANTYKSNMATGPQPELAGVVAANASLPASAPGDGQGNAPPPAPSTSAALGQGAGHPGGGVGDGASSESGGGSNVGPGAGAAAGGADPAGGGGAEPPEDVRDAGEEANSEGAQPGGPYGPGTQRGGAQEEKATGPDPNRTDPITPATGAQQTPATANSIIGANQLVKDTIAAGPEAVKGNAVERANLGEGSHSNYENQGPFNFPQRPSGRLDSTLTSMGAWRSKTGPHTNSLWSSTYTEKGEPAKKEKYYKWSSKGGGNWKKLPRNKALNILSKEESRRQGGRWLEVPQRGQKLPDIMAATLKRKMEDIQMGKAGNVEKNKRMKGQGGRVVQK